MIRITEADIDFPAVVPGEFCTARDSSLALATRR